VLADQDGSVWFATAAGLNRLLHDEITVYRDHPRTTTDGRAQRFRSAREISGLGLLAQGVGSVFQDRVGRVWITSPRGIGYLTDDRLVSIRGVPGGITHSIAEDNDGNLWFANQDLGLFRLLRDGGAVERIPWKTLGQDEYAISLVSDPQRGGVWLGLLQSGIVHVVDGNVRESYSAADGLGEGIVNALHVDREGTLWAATEGGLSRLQNGRIATLTSENGLPCDLTRWVVEDDARSLWLSMSCALVRVARHSLDRWIAALDSGTGTTTSVEPEVFDSADGVRLYPLASYFNPQVAKSTDGRLWFGSTDGVSVVDPRRLSVNRLPPPVHIEQVTADRKPYEVGGRKIQLPALTRDLQIDYTALSFVAPEKMRFRYKLENHDRDWQDVGTRRQAFYNDLRPGTYRFRVTASNNSGVWNEAGAFLDFSVAPAYYQTGWFMALSAGMVLAVAWGAHRIRLRVVERHEREITALNERMMKAQEQERIRIAGDLHDGVMQDMLAVTMMLGSAKRKVASDADAKAAIDKVQEKVIKVGADIRRVSHDLHPPVLQQAGLPQALQTYCEEFSTSSGVPVSCEADENARALSRGAALALFRIVQEAIGNAVKHGAAKRITVRLERSGSVVTLEVSDDGAGFERSRLAAGGGLGLITMRERASQLDGTFEVDSAAGRGTTIRVVIPFR
jgi:signal transduction histidine kinase